MPPFGATSLTCLVCKTHFMAKMQLYKERLTCEYKSNNAIMLKHFATNVNIRTQTD